MAHESERRCVSAPCTWPRHEIPSERGCVSAPCTRPRQVMPCTGRSRNPASFVRGIHFLLALILTGLSAGVACAQPNEGTLEGRVTFVGELPKIADLTDLIRKHADAEHVLKAPKDQLLDPTWRIDPKTRGVANVCVFLKAPANAVFPIQKVDQVRKEAVVLDAPHTIFVPHMTAIYPQWSDGKDVKFTGQRLIVRNSSPVAQAIRWIGHPRYNPDFGVGLPPAGDFEPSLNPQPLPVTFVNAVHPWAKAYVWVFDHPYFAITKEDGTFRIPRVPTGVNVQVMAWHEDRGWLFTSAGKPMRLDKGKNVLDFEIESDSPKKGAANTIEGRIIFADVPPKLAALPNADNPKLNGLLLQAQKKGLLEPLLVDPKNDGVANAVVFIKRPKDGKLPISEADKVRKETIVMDAPLMAFEPRVVALYQHWSDGKTRGQTGQKFIIKNSSPVTQSHRINGHPRYNEGWNRNVPPGEKNECELYPQPGPVRIQCSFRTWMNASAFVFDHPYFAITKADGSFTIPNVPLGREVEVQDWHETRGFLFTKSITLGAGKNRIHDFDISQIPELK